MLRVTQVAEVVDDVHYGSIRFTIVQQFGEMIMELKDIRLWLQVRLRLKKNANGVDASSMLRR